MILIHIQHRQDHAIDLDASLVTETLKTIYYIKIYINFSNPSVSGTATR